MLAKFDVANEVSKRINEGLSAGDFDAYLASVDKLLDAISFFRRNSNFKSAETTLARLQEISKKAVQECEDEFRSLLTRHSVPIEPLKLLGSVSDKSDKKETVPAATLSRMRKIAKRLRRCGKSSYLEIYVRHRGEYVMQSLEKMDLGSITQQSEAAKYGSRKDRSSLPTLNPSNYRRRSHKFITVLQVFQKLVEGERVMAQQVLDADDSQRTLEKVIRPSLDLFIEKAELIILQSSYDTLFILLDIYDAFSKTPPIQLRPGRSERDVEEVVVKLANQAKKFYLDYENCVRNNNARTLANDGTVHELTSNTMSYIKRLVEFQDVVQVLLATTSADAASTKPAPALPANILAVVSGLVSALEMNARKYRPNTVLEQLFLVNNLCYIIKHMRSDALVAVTGPKLLRSFDSQLQQLLQQYYTASCSKAAAALQAVEVRWKKPNVELVKPCCDAIKAAFVSFSSAFFEQLTTQTHYAVPDEDMRRTLIARLKQDLHVPYLAFYAKYEALPFSKHKDKYVRYSPDAIDALIDTFFTDT